MPTSLNLGIKNIDNSLYTITLAITGCILICVVLYIFPNIVTPPVAIILLLLISIIAVAPGMISNIRLRSSKYDNADFRKFIRICEEVQEKDRDKIKYDGKIEKFVNTSTISFHYANKEQVENFYNDYFKEPAIKYAINEIVTEAGGELKGSLPELIESKTNERDVNKWINTIKIPDISLAEKFRKYQRSVIENKQVTLGLELVDIDLSEYTEFRSSVNMFERTYNMKLDPIQIEQQSSKMKKNAAEKTINRLENATAWVIVEGKFSIINDSTDYYKCMYYHPVNEYLGDDEKKITISIMLKKDSIEPNYRGNYSQSIDRSIPLVVFGNVWAPVDRKSDIWELQISPTVVY